MREKLLGISRRLRELAATDGFQLITPDEMLEEIADIIDEELQGNEHDPRKPNMSIGAQSMGIDTIRNKQ